MDMILLLQKPNRAMAKAKKNQQTNIDGLNKKHT